MHRSNVYKAILRISHFFSVVRSHFQDRHAIADSISSLSTGNSLLTERRAPMTDQNRSNQCKKMKIHERYSIEGYKDLSSWNAQDAQILMSFDRILLPVSITGLAVSLGRFPTTYPYAYVGSWLLLTYWIFLSWRKWARQDERFHIMHAMEVCLGFRAHLLLKDRKWPLQDRRLRWIVYGVVVIIASIAGAVPVHSCVPRPFDFWLWRALLWGILPVFSLIFWRVTKTLAQKEEKEAKQDSK